jgi:SAM-dependent methyltransferase
MLIESVLSVLDIAEKDMKIAGRHDVIMYLRKVGLDDFGLILIGMPDNRYPRVSSFLPKMASDEVQRNWTGNHGAELLKLTNTFVRFLAATYITQANKSLDGISVLDFGCGYGRIMRSMYYYIAPENVFGVDPWDLSVSECISSGIGSNVFLSQYLPHDLPVDRHFELIYAFSVFTHLSGLATKQALKTLRNYVTPDGVLVITIRPLEYWWDDPNVPGEMKLDLVAAHKSAGYAFLPHAVGGQAREVTYGDTSMTIEWLKANIPDWDVALIDHPLLDPYQIYVVLRPA